MRVLVIVADCLYINSSANLCHLSYIKGLCDLNYDVTVLHCSPKGHIIDHSMKIPEGVRIVNINGISLYQRISNIFKNKKEDNLNISDSKSSIEDTKVKTAGLSFVSRLINLVKKKLLDSYGVYNIYSTFIRKSKSFCDKELFDYVLSISSPDASHLVAGKLINSKHIICNSWIQIWEDPWSNDIYAINDKNKSYYEEKNLLHLAERVCYVSPLTLKYQKQIFTESAHKMYWQPLPYYYKDNTVNESIHLSKEYGYFGDYAPAARDLKPFYIAAKNTNINVNICGNPSNLLEPTENISIYPRLPLAELKPIEDKTNVLIFLCNLKGGQIPGKIYQYSATNKTILFILDGTVEEKKVLREYFEPFNRYVFCENTVEDITRAINLIENNEFGNIKNVSIEDFNPKNTIKKILEG